MLCIPRSGARQAGRPRSERSKMDLAKKGDGLDVTKKGLGIKSILYCSIKSDTRAITISIIEDLTEEYTIARGRKECDHFSQG